MKDIVVLETGYVRFIESWGSDERIIESARMSTGKGFEGWPKDERLLAYLYNNKHATPFEMAGLVVEVKAPIFVFREWHRHRTQSYNEMSARYVPLPDENYLPTTGRLLANASLATANRQAQGNGAELTLENAKLWLAALKETYKQVECCYQLGLGFGIPKEIARLCIPAARYSRMRASANLRNWLAFLTLRMAPNAQWEIQQYANALGELIAEHFPRTWALFEQEQNRG